MEGNVSEDETDRQFLTFHCLFIMPSKHTRSSQTPISMYLVGRGMLHPCDYGLPATPGPVDDIIRN